MSEKLSNLLDEKVNRDELDDFLSACKDNPQLMDLWQRYHVARDMVKNEISDADLKFNVVDKVMAEVTANPNAVVELKTVELKTNAPESNVVGFSAKDTQTGKKPWLPMAIAASMLLGLYVYVQQPSQQNNVENLVAETIQTEAIETELVSISSMPHWQTENAAIEDTLNALLVEHSEFTSVTGMNGLGSYSKFVSYRKL